MKNDYIDKIKTLPEELQTLILTYHLMSLEVNKALEFQGESPVADFALESDFLWKFFMKRDYPAYLKNFVCVNKLAYENAQLSEVYCFIEYPRNSNPGYKEKYKIHNFTASGSYFEMFERAKEKSPETLVATFNTSLREFIVDPTIRDLDGHTPLTLASMFGNLKVVSTLIACGVKLDLTCNLSWNALHHAASNGLTEIVLYLIEAGVPIDSQNKEGSSALHLAVKSGHSITVKALLKQGADINLQTNVGSTALHLACKDDMVEDLLEMKPSLELQDKIDGTPLHMAARYGFVRKATRLIEAGAKKDSIAQCTKETPFQTARNYSENDLLPILFFAPKVDVTKSSLLRQYGVWGASAVVGAAVAYACSVAARMK